MNFCEILGIKMNFCEIILPSFFFFFSSNYVEIFPSEYTLLWKINLLLLLWNILIVWLCTKKHPHILNTQSCRETVVVFWSGKMVLKLYVWSLSSRKLERNTGLNKQQKVMYPSPSNLQSEQQREWAIFTSSTTEYWFMRTKIKPNSHTYKRRTKKRQGTMIYKLLIYHSK